jgi:bleomycin hydrolase
MKNLRVLFVLLLALLSFNLSAKKGGGDKASSYNLEFSDTKVLPATSVKDQYRTSTCWSFSGLSFLESEMLRLGKPEVDLSEMFIVWHAYSEKAEKDARVHGALNFSAGGAFHDVTNMIRKYGIVPESVYNGLQYGETKHIHGEMDKVLKEQIDAVIENKNGRLSTAWHDAVESTLDNYLGEIPAKFEYKGKEYTPRSFALEYVGLNLDDYVEISSYSHHPFYTKFILEVPDNWSWDEVYNVPVNEMQEIIDNSLATGYTVAWASDISEKGFSTGKYGVAIVPEADGENEPIVDSVFLTTGFTEGVITQEMRQIAFDNYQTTDDHGMHIVGLAKDQDGREFYKVKNSWGQYNKYNGYFYASKPFVNYKTTCIMVHKDAIPKHIRKKLNI